MVEDLLIREMVGKEDTVSDKMMMSNLESFAR